MCLLDGHHLKLGLYSLHLNPERRLYSERYIQKPTKENDICQKLWLDRAVVESGHLSLIVFRII